MIVQGSLYLENLESVLPCVERYLKAYIPHTQIFYYSIILYKLPYFTSLYTLYLLLLYYLVLSYNPKFNCNIYFQNFVGKYKICKDNLLLEPKPNGRMQDLDLILVIDKSLERKY